MLVPFHCKKQVLRRFVKSAVKFVYNLGFLHVPNLHYAASVPAI